MTAVAGTFVKLDSVATRKVARITVEIPIEQVNQALATLGGYPDPANAQWVGVAPLNITGANTLKGGKLSQTAAIMCGEKAFWQFAEVDNQQDAAAWLRKGCGVESRAHLDHDNEAAARFREIRQSYEAWLKVA